MGYKVADQYKWIAMMDQLTGGDMTKDDEIYKKSNNDVFNRLAFWAQRDRVINKRK